SYSHFSRPGPVHISLTSSQEYLACNADRVLECSPARYRSIAAHGRTALKRKLRGNRKSPAEHRQTARGRRMVLRLRPTSFSGKAQRNANGSPPVWKGVPTARRARHRWGLADRISKVVWVKDSLHTRLPAGSQPPPDGAAR